MANLTPKTIAELPNTTSPSDNDLFAISRSSTSRKIPWSALRAGLLRECEFVEESVNVSFTAGTIGTRGFQKKLDTAAPNGKKIIGTAVTYIQDSSKLIPVLFSTGSDLYLNAYRATSDAVSGVEVRVRLTFATL